MILQQRSVIWWAILLLSLLPLRTTAQTSGTELIDREIHIDGFSRATHISTSGMNLWVEVSNNTRHRLVIKEAEIEIKINGNTATVITLRDKVVVRRRSSSEILLPLRFRSRGSFTLNSIVNRILDNDIENMTISYYFRAGTAIVKRTFTEEDIAMSDFFNTFAVEQSIVAQLQEIINNN